LLHSYRMRKKSLFLLVVFLLNNFVGLGCSLSNSHDDSHDSFDEISKHQHSESAFIIDHKEDFSLKQHATVVISSDEECCQQIINQYNSLTKQAPRQFSIPIKPVPLNLFYGYRAHTKFLITLRGKSNNLLIVTQWPPSWLSRIAIQRFQI
jgi:hypothetical protein